MTKERFEELRSQQDLSNLFYPSAKEWMWDYCLYLGSFTDSRGKNFDLGIHHNHSYTEDCHTSESEFSDATVFDNEPGSYRSGFMNNDTLAFCESIHAIHGGHEAYLECWKRLQKLQKGYDWKDIALNHLNHHLIFNDEVYGKLEIYFNSNNEIISVINIWGTKLLVDEIKSKHAKLWDRIKNEKLPSLHFKK